jgi:hypothetical protein
MTKQDRIAKFKAIALERIEDAKDKRRNGDQSGAMAQLKTAAKVTAKVLELENYGSSCITRKGLRENWAQQMLPRMYGLIAGVEKGVVQ